MSRASADLADALGKRLRTIDLTRSQIEQLSRAGALSRHAATRMYEGLYLSAHVAFEGFIEELFIGLMVTGGRGLKSARSDVAPRVDVKSHLIARELVVGPGRKYVDWLPYEKTVDLANLFFRGGRPFDDLDAVHKQALKKSHVIRNAIAHRSRHSLDQFERLLIGNTPLPSHERSPAGYLRGLYRTAPVQSRFESMVTQLLSAARVLAR